MSSEPYEVGQIESGGYIGNGPGQPPFYLLRGKADVQHECDIANAAYAAGQQSPDGWVRVGERLPLVEMEYPVIWRGREYCVRYFAAGRWWDEEPDFDDDGEVTFAVDESEYITHFLPIPAIPNPQSEE